MFIPGNRLTRQGEEKICLHFEKVNAILSSFKKNKNKVLNIALYTVV